MRWTKTVTITSTLRVAALGLLAAGVCASAGCKGDGPARPDVAVAPETAAAPADTQAAPEPPDATATPDDNDGGEAAADAGSGKPESRGFPDEAFRAKQPAAGTLEPIALPGVERFTLDNGLEVFLVPQHKLPTVFMSFEFMTGAADDPADKVGMTSVCMDLYSEGTQALDKVAWSEKLADHAVSIWTPAGKETATINFRALKREVPAGLALLDALIAAPGLRQADFERIIAKRKANLAEQRATPRGIAQRLGDALVWGRGHGYGRIALEAHLDAITLEDCRALAARLKPKGARLWVVGQLTQDEVIAQLGARFKTWSGAAPVASARPPAKAGEGALHFVQVDGAVQSMVVVAAPGPARDAADFEASMVMNKILAGSFSSRVNMNLREEKGWAYGARGGFDYEKAGGTYAIMASVETSTTALSLREIQKEIAAMRAKAPTAEELVRERQGTLLAIPAKFATPTKTLQVFKRLSFFGLPLDWFAGHQQRLAAVDGAAVFEAAKAHLPDVGWTILVVGDGTMIAKDSKKTVRAELEALAAEGAFGVGGFIALDADGVVVAD